MRKKTFALTRNKQVFFAVYQIIITFARERERISEEKRKRGGEGKRREERLRETV